MRPFRPKAKQRTGRRVEKGKEKWQKEGQMVPVEERSRLTPIERDATHDKRAEKAREYSGERAHDEESNSKYRWPVCLPAR